MILYESLFQENNSCEDMTLPFNNFKYFYFWFLTWEEDNITFLRLEIIGKGFDNCVIGFSFKWRLVDIDMQRPE